MNNRSHMLSHIALQRMTTALIQVNEKQCFFCSSSDRKSSGEKKPQHRTAVVSFTVHLLSPQKRLFRRHTGVPKQKNCTLHKPCASKGATQKSPWFQQKPYHRTRCQGSAFTQCNQLSPQRPRLVRDSHWCSQQ